MIDSEEGNPSTAHTVELLEHMISSVYGDFAEENAKLARPSWLSIHLTEQDPDLCPPPDRIPPYCD